MTGASGQARRRHHCYNTAFSLLVVGPSPLLPAASLTTYSDVPLFAPHRQSVFFYLPPPSKTGVRTNDDVDWTGASGWMEMELRLG
jgi:hypothetical protein